MERSPKLGGRPRARPGRRDARRTRAAPGRAGAGLLQLPRSTSLGALQDVDDPVAGAAYLHNATHESAVAELYDFPADARRPAVHRADRGEFLEFLRDRLDPPLPAHPSRICSSPRQWPRPSSCSPWRPTRCSEREQFVLIGEQQLAYDMVWHAVETAAPPTQAVVARHGGPGSGKSVIALSLLGELSRPGRTVLHATGSRSFTQTLRRVAGRRAPRVQRMFKYFNQFMEAERNGSTS